MQRMMFFYISVLISIICSYNVEATVIYKMGWEGASVVANDNGFSNMTLDDTDGYSPSNTATLGTDSPFGGSQYARFTWRVREGAGCPGAGEVTCAREIFISTPNVMTGIHEYYIGWAYRLSSNFQVGTGRKILYRTGWQAACSVGAESSLFHGTKGPACGQTGDYASIYLKNPGSCGGDGTEDSPWNQRYSEKNGIGGAMCLNDLDETCTNWSGCSSYPLLDSDNQWHKIIYYVKEHLTEGVHTLWIDGVKVIHVDKNAWNNVTTDPDAPCVQSAYSTWHEDFTGFKFPTYFNFGPLVDGQYEDWDNFIIATTYEEVSSYLNVTTGTISNITIGPGVSLR